MTGGNFVIVPANHSAINNFKENRSLVKQYHLLTKYKIIC